MVSASPAQESANRDHISHVARLIATGEYAQAADYIQQAQLTAENAANTGLNQLLTSIRHLCLASDQNRQQLAWHQKAVGDADVRQSDLTTQLATLLLSLSECMGEAAAPSIAKPITPPSSALVMDTSIPPTQASVRWQNLQSLFKRNTQDSPDTESQSNGWHIQTEAAAPQPTPNPNSLIVYTLGAFQVYRNNELVENLLSRKGNLILKYLMVNRERPIHKEVLMDLLWEDSEEEAQRNNLNVAVYSLRQALRNGDPTFSHILFQNDCYFLNPELTVWVDHEAFMESYKEGRRHKQNGHYGDAIQAYELAETLYQGIFLPEDTYEEWTENLRQSLQSAYLSLLDSLSRYYLDQQDYARCVATCNKMLDVDSCFEEAHIRLMRCYSRQGQTYLALRQYDRCMRTLEAELDVEPEPETTVLYDQLRAGKRI